MTIATSRQRLPDRRANQTFTLECADQQPAADRHRHERFDSVRNGLAMMQLSLFADLPVLHRSVKAGCRHMPKWRNQMAEIMTPENPRWEQFTDLMLDGMEWNGCDGGRNQTAPENVHRQAKAVLETMGGVDVDKTLQFFESRGGYCDCEILLNVDPW
jgi:Protein of unknown function (DUF2695)